MAARSCFLHFVTHSGGKNEFSNGGLVNVHGFIDLELHGLGKDVRIGTGVNR